MIDTSTALAAIPSGLRDPLLSAYKEIIGNFSEHRWSPAELSGGKFCEVVYSILDGYANGSYPVAPSKPPNFVGACRALESKNHVPRSFQILIPRILPALYEIRNNRGVGHVGGDVDPNHMDATAVVSMCDWVLAELIRVFHSSTIDEAQDLVDVIAERRIPLVWQNGDIKRVLNTKLSLQNQILVLLSSSPSPVSIEKLRVWLDYDNRAYFLKLLRDIDKSRSIYLDKVARTAQILPPGTKIVEQIVADQQVV